jgi:hypothetical protein
MEPQGHSTITPRSVTAIWFNQCMGGKMRYVFHRHLFLLIGLLTLSLFFLVAGLDRVGESETAHALAGPMRVLIVPMYLVWMVITMALVAVFGPVGLPGPLGFIVSGAALPLGLTPYVFADYFLDRCRQAAAREASANYSSGPPNVRLEG